MNKYTILEFWFNELTPEQWWKVDEELDQTIKERFSETLTQAAAGEFWGWRETMDGRLAEVIVLDQFSRNIYRGTPGAFSQDPMALALAQEAVSAGAMQAIEDPVKRSFLIMPYMHSESKRVHEEAVRLFADHTTPLNDEFERKHQAIVVRFGRYPHRNAILGRESTLEEIEFLKQPGSSF